jgi:hypothetical protein
MPFECSRCGECCERLGLVHIIKEDYGDFRFLLYNNYTGEEAPVSIDPDKRDLFLDRSIFTSFPESCPFFRYEPVNGKACCTAHLTRPEICHDYRCWRLLILNPRGRMVGKVKNIRTLCSEDPHLTKVWESCVENIPEPEDGIWEDEMIHILTRAGFTVRR